MKRTSAYLALFLVGLATGGYFVNNVLHGQAGGPPPAAAIPKEVGSYRDVVKKVLPAVVSIEARAKVAPGKGRPPVIDDPRIPEEHRRFFEEFRNLPELPELPKGFGSGFVVDANGIVVTNNHVVAGAETVIVHLHDGRKLTSKEIRTDRRTDLAVIFLDAKAGPFPFLELGDSDAMEIGDRVLAVGAPFGLAGTVTHGIISGKGRNGLNLSMYEDYLQTDAAINPGNSGGPLISLDGKVVGINTAIKTKTGGFQGVGLAIASTMARDIVEKLRTVGVVKRGYLGVQIRELSDDAAKLLGLPKETGVVVGEVFDKTPAAKAGLKAGDVILTIGGKDLKDGRMLQSTVATLPLGKETTFVVFRGGKLMEFGVVIDEQPTEFGGAPVPAPRVPVLRVEGVAVEKLGIELADLTETLAEGLGYRGGVRGAVVARVAPGGLGHEAGLRPGMVISHISKAPVEDAATARKALEGGDMARGILLQVQSATGGTSYIVIHSEG